MNPSCILYYIDRHALACIVLPFPTRNDTPSRVSYCQIYTALQSSSSYLAEQADTLYDHVYNTMTHRQQTAWLIRSSYRSAFLHEHNLCIDVMSALSLQGGPGESSRAEWLLSNVHTP